MNKHEYVNDEKGTKTLFTLKVISGKIDISANTAPPVLHILLQIVNKNLKVLDAVLKAERRQIHR